MTLAAFMYIHLCTVFFVVAASNWMRSDCKKSCTVEHSDHLGSNADMRSSSVSLWRKLLSNLKTTYTYIYICLCNCASLLWRRALNMWIKLATILYAGSRVVVRFLKLCYWVMLGLSKISRTRQNKSKPKS